MQKIRTFLLAPEKNSRQKDQRTTGRRIFNRTSLCGSNIDTNHRKQSLRKKSSFPSSISSVNIIKSARNCRFDLVIFTEDIFNEKLHFLRS